MPFKIWYSTAIPNLNKPEPTLSTAKNAKNREVSSFGYPLGALQ